MSFAASHDDAMDFPEALGPRDSTFEGRPEPRRDHIMAEPQFENVFEDRGSEDRSFAESADSTMMTQTLDHISDRTGEVISLEAMRSNMAPNFEPDDLDVPAFLRKRNEVM